MHMEKKRVSKNLVKKILLLGSGGLRIGQAGEFDYSGTQAIKALKEEGIHVVLVNPNIATVQTDPGLADTLYLLPLDIPHVTSIIKKERPDGILLGFGGQTALNLGLTLAKKGILKKYHVRVLGTPISTITKTEDRGLFKKNLEKIGVKTPRSVPAKTTAEALVAARTIGYPLMLRSGYSLGGLGSGKIENEKELASRAEEALHHSPDILIEEYLEGWKEIEYEIVRDRTNTTLTICNMENFDPMGVHTGESIVVAPAQTLSNEEYHRLREISLKVARAMGIVGECNIQYALNPESGDYRVIEMNARLSRSSALASKATGYPLAFVATKLALGYTLHELKNSVTKKTTACFEPALDYVVIKIPRWDTTKFKTTNRRIGSEMKSVGEVMAIGRTFPEALQKAVRMLNIGVSGLGDYHTIPNLKDEIVHPTDRRLFALYQALQKNNSVETLHAWSCIDKWFLYHLHSIATMEKEIEKKPLSQSLLHDAKKYGFADATIACLKKTTADIIRKKRIALGITPFIKQIDTLAGEFPAETNYLYITYHGSEHDVIPAGSSLLQNKKHSKQKPLLIIGSGPYCIGSSVEFDWCAVNTARTLRTLKEKTIIVNSNPETVSTDYDESDRLYFEELTLERLEDIIEFENPKGVIVSVGGQIANNLVLPLAKKGVPLLGTPATCIDQAENRARFSLLLEKLKIDQPRWSEVTNLVKAKAFVNTVGYPLLVRPSYVLSGAAMNIIYNDTELEMYLQEAALISKKYPVVISEFITDAKELEIDGVAENGNVLILAIAEHIENAGVHSGDATIVLPPQKLYLETIRRTKQAARQIAAALKITGPFNIQFLAKHNDIKVIECNLRASRSFPFVSKVTGYNLIEIATRALLHYPQKQTDFETLELAHVGVKTAQFSYQRVKGSDPIARVEMTSTGEVACLGSTYLEAFYTSWQATEQNLVGKKILLSIGGNHKDSFLESIRTLDRRGYEFFATGGTHDFLAQAGVASTYVAKASEHAEPNVLTLIKEKKIDFIINIPNQAKLNHETDGFKIRRQAIDHKIPLITNLPIAQLFLRCLVEVNNDIIEPTSWQEYMTSQHSSVDTTPV